MGSNLWKIVAWAQKEGPVKAVERINMIVLAETMKENISLKDLQADTTCSADLEKAIRKAAETVVGARCPV